jgi:uncharacterized protein YuzE
MGKKRERIIKEIDEKNDIAYIGLPTNSSTIGIDLDDDITIHFDTKKNMIIGITILHWKRFKEKLELKERAKESIKTITDYILKNYSKKSVLPLSYFFYKKFVTSLRV